MITYPQNFLNKLKEVATPLAHIVNLSLSHGIFPNDMKLDKIVPIFKNGNTKLFNNYVDQ